MSKAIALTSPKRYHFGNLHLHPDIGWVTQQLLDKGMLKAFRYSPIAKKMKPPVSVTSLQRYHRERVNAVVRKRIGEGGRPIGRGPYHSPEEFFADIQNLTAQEYCKARLNRKDQRNEIAAEACVANEDWGTLARVDIADTKNLELRARLEGLLEGPKEVDGERLVVVMPMPPEGHMKKTVDITVEHEALPPGR